MSPPPTGIAMREFARREGCDPALVRRAVKTGRLQVLAGGLIDPALVGSGWRKTNRRAGDTGGDTGDTGGDSPHPGPQGVLTTLEPQPAGGALKRSRRAEAAGDADALDPEVDNVLAELLAGRGLLSLADAERRKENYLAALRQHEFQVKSGAYILLADAEAAFFRAAREIRDAWANWASRIATEAAAELGVEARALTEVLTRHVQQHLAELGEPEFEPGAEG